MNPIFHIKKFILVLSCSSISSCTFTVPAKQWIAISAIQEGERADIYLVQADGTGLKQVTSSINESKKTWKNTHPVWSPNGQQIAFMSTQEGNSDIYVINQDGSNLINLSKDKSYDGYPAWTPDGQHLIFYSERNSGGLFQVDIQTRQLKQLTQSSGLQIPYIAPQGDKIALCEFNGRPGRSGFPQSVSVIKSDGSRKVQLSKVPLICQVHWSKNGQKIALTEYKSPQKVLVNIFSVNTKSQVKLEKTFKHHSVADWSFQNQGLLLWHWPSQAQETWKLCQVQDKQEGKFEKNILKTFSKDSENHLASWHPDGHSITLFSSQLNRLYSMNILSGKTVPLFDGEVPLSRRLQFSWQSPAKLSGKMHSSWN